MQTCSVANRIFSTIQFAKGEGFREDSQPPACDGNKPAEGLRNRGHSLGGPGMEDCMETVGQVGDGYGTQRTEG